MKKFLLASIFGLTLSGCVSITDGITDKDTPLHSTIDAIKSELRVFSRELRRDSKKYTLSCNGSIPATDVKFQSIKIDLAVSETKVGGLSGESVLNSGPGFTVKGEGSRTKIDTDTLTIHLVPDAIPSADSSEKIIDDGIAEALLALMSELAAVNDQPPCLNIASGADGTGPGATLSLGFSVETVKGGEAGINFVIIKVGGKKSKTKKFSNTITVNVGIDGQTLFAPAAALQ